MLTIPWEAFALTGWLLVAIAAGLHALLNLPDPRAAWGWIAVTLLFPFAGPVLYVLFGINRVQTRARQIVQALPDELDTPQRDDAREQIATRARLEPRLPLVHTGDSVTASPLLAGNQIRALSNGEEAFPPMLAAIDAAEQSIALATYIFETNPAGRDFIDALGRAHDRGVDIRVLVDGIGELYSIPRAVRLLRRRGIRCARFHPPQLLPPSLHINLRNHRKVLLVDGRIGFTGGMNIGSRYLIQEPSRVQAADTHFEVVGPVLSQLASVFSADWYLATGEAWAPSCWDAEQPAEGGSICRVITDGPNEDLDHLRLVLEAAIGSARERIRIMTPYFLPPPELEAALTGAALRGVQVDILLPAKNDVRAVHYASRHKLGRMMESGLNIWYQPPPFRHSKLFVVDDDYAMIGSANLDARSLRLNFELAVEIYDDAFCADLHDLFNQAIDASSRLTPDTLNQRGGLERIRDAGCWLFSPYL
ncbi:MAG: phospholipase D-like domain-containing protein [Abyssibacter sp.]|uniref:phospholipase D-like domain-containing protein n=1 Tax=Abyssibacter sp. TaxID=2320200 RepID=UPI00321A2EE3